MVVFFYGTFTNIHNRLVVSFITPHVQCSMCCWCSSHQIIFHNIPVFAINTATLKLFRLFHSCACFQKVQFLVPKKSCCYVNRRQKLPKSFQEKCCRVVGPQSFKGWIIKATPGLNKKISKIPSEIWNLPEIWHGANYLRPSEYGNISELK